MTLVATLFLCNSLCNIWLPSSSDSGRVLVFAAAASVESNRTAFDTAFDERKEELAHEERKLSLNGIFVKAAKRGLGGGIPGAVAGVVQVLSMVSHQPTSVEENSLIFVIFHMIK